MSPPLSDGQKEGEAFERLRASTQAPRDDRELYLLVGELKEKVRGLEREVSEQRKLTEQIQSKAESLQTRVVQISAVGAVLLFIAGGVICPVAVEMVKTKWVTPPDSVATAAKPLRH